MKKILLLYNSRAGDSSFSARLHDFVEVFQEDYIVEMCDVTGVELSSRLSKLNISDYSFFIIAGGDGTVNRVINILMKFNIKVPAGILPVGTSNDFGEILKMPDNFIEYRQLLREGRGNIKNLDIGLVNEKYFINVCASGFLTSVAYETPSDLKNLFGKVAYYLKGVQKLTDLNPLPLKISTPDNEIEKDFCIVLILNSGRAGGFKKITPERSLNDGKFELVGIEYSGVYEMFTSLVDVFINNSWQESEENITFLRSDSFNLQMLDSNRELKSDIDGEEGPLFPLDVKIEKEAFPFVVNAREISDILKK